MTAGGRERSRIAAKVLPILAMTAWVATIWVPVFDSTSNSLHSNESMALIVTSLGRRPITLSEIDVELVVIWACLLTCVISGWLVNGLRLWAWAAAVLGIVVMSHLGAMVEDPPTIMWDGKDGDGMWIGGMEVASPSVGAAFWAFSGVVLVTAGICGLISERHRSNVRIRRWFATHHRTSGRPGRATNHQHISAVDRAACLFPLLALASWIVMIWVPIMDNTASDEDDVTFTSLGRQTADLVDFEPSVVIAWLIVLICAVVGLANDLPRWWPAIVLGLGVVLYALLVERLAHPPIVRWAGETTDGQSISASIVGYPAAGVSYWALGSAALVSAGICGLIGQRRQHPINAKRRRLIS